MATHHVSPRRACPALLDVNRITGQVLPQKQPGSSAAHHVQDTLVLLPARTIYCGTRKHYLIGEVEVSYESILAQASAVGNHTRLSAKANASHFIRMASRYSGFTGYSVT